MGRQRAKRDMTIEEFNEWSAATKKFEAVAERADEPGGPRLSLVPAVLPQQNEAWPTDFVPPPEAAGDPAMVAESFASLELPESQKLAGWSAKRQRRFLQVLAETGQVHIAADAARLSARSAYALRTRSPAFAAAWDTALQLSVGRLAAMAFDRAINGRIEQVYSDGELIAEKRVPNDRLLTWLLSRLDPKRFALPWEQRGNADPQAEAVAAWPERLDGLADVPS